MEPTLVFPLSLRVEHLACITAQTAPNRDADRQSLLRSNDGIRCSCAAAGSAQKVKCVKFLIGIKQEPLNVTKALYVFYRESGIPKADGPVVSVSRKQADTSRRTLARLGFCFVPGCEFGCHESTPQALANWLSPSDVNRRAGA